MSCCVVNTVHGVNKECVQLLQPYSANHRAQPFCVRVVRLIHFYLPVANKLGIPFADSCVSNE